MTEDILKFFPLNTNNECGGLFKTSIKDRTWSDKPNKNMHGVSYTKFPEAFDITYGPAGCTQLFTMFHKNCYQYACLFLENNPDWTIYELQRDGFYHSTVHCFAVKRLPDGRNVFADARGYTDNPLEFFDDFKFSKTAHLLNITNDARYEKYIPIKNIMQIAYENIFKDCPYIEKEEDLTLD